MVRIWITGCLESISHEQKAPSVANSLVELLTAAYDFRDDRMFAKVGEYIITQTAINVGKTAQIIPREHIRSVLGTAIIHFSESLLTHPEQAAEHKRSIFDRIAETVDSIVDDEGQLRYENDMHVTEQCTPNCYYFERRLHLVLESLRWRKIWPSSVMRKRSLQEVWSSMKEDEWIERCLVYKEVACRCHWSQCDSQDARDLGNVQSALTACLRATRDSATAVCYYCVREGQSLLDECVHTSDSAS